MPREIENSNIQGVQDYLDRLYKIIPAELTAGYTAAQSFLGVPADDPTSNIPFLLGFGIFLTALVPLYLRRLQGVQNLSQIMVSTVSFPIWATNISVVYFGLLTNSRWVKVLGLVLIGWVLAAPVIINVPKTAP